MRVYTGGTFDLFHPGHVAFLERCAEFGDVWVGLNTDEFIAAYKGTSPVMDYREREAMLVACAYVTGVIPNTGGADSKPAILRVKPDLVVIGSDWASRDYYAQMDFTQAWLDEHDIGLAYLPYTVGISTSEIKRRVCPHP